MAKDVTRPPPTGMSTDFVNKMLTGIRESRQTTVITGTRPFMRLARDGEWIYGQSNEPIQEGTLWGRNPLSIGHGWVCWPTGDTAGQAGNKILGESMTAVHEPKPVRPEPINGFPFVEQRQIDMKCLNGEDAGTEVLFKTNSVGGMRAFDGLLAKLQTQLMDNPAYPCPVMELLVDSYNHAR